MKRFIEPGDNSAMVEGILTNIEAIAVLGKLMEMTDIPASTISRITQVPVSVEAFSLNVGSGWAHLTIEYRTTKDEFDFSWDHKKFSDDMVRLFGLQEGRALVSFHVYFRIDELPTLQVNYHPAYFSPDSNDLVMPQLMRVTGSNHGLPRDAMPEVVAPDPIPEMAGWQPGMEVPTVGPPLEWRPAQPVEVPTRRRRFIRLTNTPDQHADDPE